MKIIVDKEFSVRTELDSFIRSQVGSNVEANSAHEITVTKEEAANLGLSNNVRVLGVRVTVEEDKEDLQKEG